MNAKDCVIMLARQLAVNNLIIRPNYITNNFSFLTWKKVPPVRVQSEKSPEIGLHEVGLTGMKLAKLREVTTERKQWRRLAMTVARVPGTDNTRGLQVKSRLRNQIFI